MHELLTTFPDGQPSRSRNRRLEQIIALEDEYENVFEVTDDQLRECGEDVWELTCSYILEHPETFRSL